MLKNMHLFYVMLDMRTTPSVTDVMITRATMMMIINSTASISNAVIGAYLLFH